MVVARRDIRHHGPQHAERRTLADFLLALHVHLNLVEGNVSRALDHRLHTPCAATVHEFAPHGKFGELRRVRVLSAAFRLPLTGSLRTRHAPKSCPGSFSFSFAGNRAS